MARSAVSRNTRTTRIPKAKLAPKALALRERGYSVPMIAKALRRSDRYIRELMRYARETGESLIVEIPDAKRIEDLDPAVQELVRFTPDAFEAFFNRYSGRTLAPVHKEWVRIAIDTRRTLINCPPRHAKSTIFSAWFPIWLIAMNRNIQILIVSQTEKLAKKFANEISYHLSYNDKLNQDFGKFRPELSDWPWRPNTGELLVDGRSREVKSGDLTLQVRGAGQQILGMEADWIIVDDPVSRAIVRSETERERLSEWFHGDVMTRLEPKGTALVIGQRLHLHDLYGELAKETVRFSGGNPRWKHINFAAILQWPVPSEGVPAKVLWPQKWPFEALMDTYQDVGEALFEAMYQQNPLPEGERLARDAWLFGDDTHQGCVDLDRVVGDGPRKQTLPSVRVVSLDPSPTRFAGLLVAEMPFDGKQFQMNVLELRRERMNVRDMISNVLSAVDRYEPHYFVFEQNAAQRWLLQDPVMDSLRQRVTVIPHNTGRNKGDPVLGVQSLAVDFEYGRIRLPYGDPESKHMSHLLIDEAKTWPQGETDDLLMALWFCKFNYRSLVPRNAYTGARQGRAFHVPPRLMAGFTPGDHDRRKVMVRAG